MLVGSCPRKCTSYSCLMGAGVSVEGHKLCWFLGVGEGKGVHVTSVGPSVGKGKGVHVTSVGPSVGERKVG